MGFYLIYFTTLKHWPGRPPHSVILRHVLLFSRVFTPCKNAVNGILKKAARFFDG